MLQLQLIEKEDLLTSLIMEFYLHLNLRVPHLLLRLTLLAKYFYLVQDMSEYPFARKKTKLNQERQKNKKPTPMNKMQLLLPK